MQKVAFERMGHLLNIEALRLVVADTYALIGQTHFCHWNVRDPSFFSLHTAFESQYNGLFVAVDEVAERIRAKGSLALGGLSKLAEMAGIEELPEDSSAQEMVLHLVKARLIPRRRLSIIATGLIARHCGRFRYLGPLIACQNFRRDRMLIS